ncbi:MAG: RNA-guided endonuclease TnpB family protein [Xenococcaceae cyanobacterium MO_207.B15]|nr:RNA-guided endonuclease TnpB family protein [Xenococcaceae cyanobacterium MO_207.B15]
MIHQAVKVRIYPKREQSLILAQHFGCARWWWNYALNKCIETYKQTGKGLTRSAMNSMLPRLKKEEETKWLKDCYSQVLQSVSLNLSRAYLNFFAGRAKYPRFKSKSKKQSIQYPQQVKQVDSFLKFPGRLGTVKAKIHRPFDGKIKTVTITYTPSGKYYASVLLEREGDVKGVNTDGKIIGIDLGIKDFAITNDGIKTSFYANPRHLSKHQKNLKRKLQKLARKQQGSNRRNKARRLAAKVYENISNVRQDFLHKLSRKIVNNNQVVVVENLNVKGMVRNHKLAKAISDCSWGKFVNFLDYKLSQEGKLLVEINRFFPSSKTCSSCHYTIDKLSLDIRSWTCPSCGTHHDRDENAAKNIRAEGIRILQTSLGTSDAANGGNVRPKLGRVFRLGDSL